MVPTELSLCGSVIESPLFRASAMSHPCILGVYLMSHHLRSQYSIHICISFILCCPFWPLVILSPSPLELSQLLPGQPCTLCSDKGSRLFVPQSHSPLSLVSVHQSHYYFASCFSCRSSLPHLSWALFCQNQLIYSRRTPRGRCISFQLPFLFGALDRAEGLIIALWLGCFMFVFHTLDGIVMQRIVRVIPGCVWDLLNLIRVWPFR